MKPRTPFARLVAAYGRLRAPQAERATVLGTAVVVGALAILNVAKHALPPGDMSLSAAAALALLVYARRNGVTWEQLGLGRDQLRSGGAWALGAVLTVAAAYALGVLHPTTRGAFLDSRYDEGLPQALVTSLLVIPVGTVALEELAFRSVLWGMLERQATARGALALTSGLFGLWHVLPSLDFASAHQPAEPVGLRRKAVVAAGTVAFTALGGAVAGELRRRSGSVVASAGMHWATNGLGVLFGLAAWRLERRRTGTVHA